MHRKSIRFSKEEKVMNRQEFLRQLESLLMNIPANERADALAYYNDYFNEAGIENEQSVIQELGSPQKVAQSIIDDVRNSEYRENDQMHGYEESANQYTQNSYQNQNQYQNRNQYQGQNSYQNQYQNTYQNYHDVEKKKFKTWQIVLIVILLILTSPVLIGVVTGLFGGLIGIIAGIFGTVVGLFGSALGLVIGGIAVVVLGVLRVMINPLESVTCIGIGLLLFAIGILLALLFGLLTFAWLPKLVRAITGWLKSLLHRNKGGNEI